MPKSRTINIPLDIKGDKVTLSKRDWDRIVSYITDRDIGYTTSLSLIPKAKPKMKRGTTKKKAKVTEP